MNVEIIGDDDESGVEIPGGMGACGAPNDSWHHVFTFCARHTYAWQLIGTPAYSSAVPFMSSTSVLMGVIVLLASFANQ